MRRILIVILAVMLCSFGLFAGYNRFGIGSGVEFYWNQTELTSDGINVSGYDFSVPVFLEGANFFGRNSNLGVGYGLGVLIPVYSEMGGVSLSGQGASIRPTVSFRFHHKFNDLISMEAGLGYLFEYNSANVADDWVSTIRNSVVLDTGVAFNIEDVVSIMVAVDMMTPFYTHQTIQDSDGSTIASGQYKQYGVALSPRVSVVKTY